MDTAYYFPWVRKGLGTYVQEKDSFGQRFEGMALNRPEIRLTAEFMAQKGNTTFGITHEKTVKFVGPTDIAGMNDKAVMKVVPSPGSSGFPVQYFPYVEFWEPDFPWRYTPASPDEDRLRPWMALVCCEASAVKVQAFPNGTRYCTFTGSSDQWKDCFLKPSGQWRSAHAQGGAPDRPEIARLLALRNSDRLEPETEYQVLMLPAFETGRLRGLGYDESDVAEIPAQLPSWEEALEDQRKREMGLVFPVYHAWSFKTGIDDFDTMVRRLRPACPEKDGIILDVTKMGEGLDYDTVSHFSSRRTIRMPAATRTIGAGTQKPFPTNDASTESILYRNIRTLLSQNPVFTENASDKTEGFQATYTGDDDPLVVPPVYGARHVLASSLGEVGWVEELNMDIHYRAAAGLGKSVVQNHQEELMNRAWKQVKAVNALNMELYNRLLSLNTGKALQAKLPRYVEGDNSRYLASLMQLLGSMANASDGNVSLSSILSDASIPRAFASATFQKTTEQLSRIVAGLDATTVMERLVEEQFYRKGAVVRHDACPASETLGEIARGYNFLQWTERETCPMARFVRFTCPDKFQDNNCTNLANKPLLFGDSLPDNYIHNTSAFIVNRPYMLLDKYMSGANTTGKTGTEAYYLQLKEFFDKGLDKYPSYGYIIPDADLDEIRKSFTMNMAKDWSLREKDASGKDRPQLAIASNGNLLFTRNGKTSTYKPNLVVMPEGEFALGNQYCFVEFDGRYYTGYQALQEWQLPRWGVSGYITYDKKTILSDRPVLVDSLIPDLIRLSQWTQTSGPGVSVPYDPLLRMVGDPSSLFEALKVSDLRVDNTGIYETLGALLTLILKTREWMRRSPSYVIFGQGAFDAKGPYGRGGAVYKWDPSHAVSNLLNVPSDSAWKVNYRKLKRTFEQLAAEVKNRHPEASAQPSSVPAPAVSALQEALDNNEAYDRMREVAELYYSEFFADTEQGEKLREGYIDELLLSRYPILAYPIFPEPAYYYLKLISEKFIIPGIDQLPEDSVSMFESNPAFVEAFLCGMNTEMGQELLWREYPTDRRGSYFRKFWDSESTASAIRSDRFFDIRPVHAWTAALGGNHLESKTGLLIFAIKGRLLRQYPNTRVYLQRAVAGKTARTLEFDSKATVENGGILSPVMETFLREDTLMVGFKTDVRTALGNPSGKDYGYFLTFEEDVEDLNFQLDTLDGATDAAKTADRLKNDPSIFGKHVSMFIK